MQSHPPRRLNFWRKLLLTAAGAAAFTSLVLVRVCNGPRAHAQAPAESGRIFEVASVKPSAPDSRGMSLQIVPGGGLNASGATLKSLIELAYEVQDFQISGGPPWMRNDRWDIVAKPDRPEGPTDMRDMTAAQRSILAGQFRERTRRLLADRFQLAVRRESTERPVYLLVQAKTGPKLRIGTERGGIGRNLGRIDGKGARLEMLAKVLSSVMGRPVLDRTGLTGDYDFELRWAEESGGPKDRLGADAGDAAPPDTAGPSIFSAIQEQIGLKLDAGKAPVDMLVIERAEKPSAN